MTHAPDGPGAEKAGHSNAQQQSGGRQPVATSTAHGAAAYLPASESQRHGVALCLSGGGFRAALFHLGALRRLNEYGFLSQVGTVSAVSGRSILSAHLAQRISPWPAPGASVPDWEKLVAAPFREFTWKNLRTWLPLLGLLEQLLPVGPIRGAAVKLLAKRYVRRLTPLRLPELPDRPRFVFCATDMVFGVNWVFDSRTDALGKGCVGDYQAGYAHPAPPWFVGRAVAASSCFPPVFKPVPAALSPKRLTGGRYGGRDREKLVGKIGPSDGGVYDNLALEPVWKDHRTVMVSDGGGIFKAARDWGVLWRLQRYFAIANNQDHALRKRWLISNFLTNQMQGAYWGIGSTSGHYGTQTPGYSERLGQDVIAEIRTDLDAFSPAECAVLENHGYLVAEAAIHAHLGPAFSAPGPPPALVIPHPEWMDEDKVRRALGTSGRSQLAHVSSLRGLYSRIAGALTRLSSSHTGHYSISVTMLGPRDPPGRNRRKAARNSAQPPGASAPPRSAGNSRKLRRWTRRVKGRVGSGLILAFLIGAAGLTPEASVLAAPAAQHQRCTAHVPASAQRNSRAEQWVRKHLGDENPNDPNAIGADLSKFDGPRFLSGRFLVQLLREQSSAQLPHGVRITHAVVVDSLNLDDVDVPTAVAITASYFMKTVHAIRSVFRRGLVLDDSYFTERVDFSNARIVGNLQARGAKFTFPGAENSVSHEVEAVNFDGMSVGGSVNIGGKSPSENSCFAGPVAFTNARIEGSLRARYASFTFPGEENPVNHEVEAVNFDKMRVGGSVILRDSTFAGPVDFASTHAGSDFHADNTHFVNETPSKFHGKDAAVDFDFMTVGGTMRFHNAIFRGPVFFAGAIVKGDFRVDNARFNYTQRRPGAIEPQFALEPTASFVRMSVDGAARFTDAHFFGAVDLRSARFAMLDLEGVVWPLATARPQPAIQLQLDGMTYQNLKVGSGEHTLEGFLDVLWRAEYSASGYANLEAMFQRQGFLESANKVYLMRKIRERKDGELGWLARVSSFLLEIFVGYGRYPQFALCWSLGFVLVGAVIFRLGSMVPIKDGQPVESGIGPEPPAPGGITPACRTSLLTRGRQIFWALFGQQVNGRYYGSLVYSLDLFAPVIDLGVAKAWMPNPKTHPKLVLWTHVWRIAGWVLVPLGVAAVTGLVK